MFASTMNVIGLRVPRLSWWMAFWWTFRLTGEKQFPSRLRIFIRAIHTVGANCFRPKVILIARQIRLDPDNKVWSKGEYKSHLRLRIETKIYRDLYMNLRLLDSVFRFKSHWAMCAISCFFQHKNVKLKCIFVVDNFFLVNC